MAFLVLSDLLDDSNETGKSAPNEFEARNPPNQQRSAQVVAAQKVCRDYSRARSWDELQLFVRNWDRVQPLMRRYYNRMPFPSEELDKLNDGVFISLPDDDRYGTSREIIVFNGTYRNDSRVQFICVPTLSGPKVDWEGMVGYNLMTLTDFKGAHPTHPQPMRVRVAEADYGASITSGGHDDESDFLRYRLTHPDEPTQVLYGSVQRGSFLANELEEIFRYNKQRPGTVDDPDIRVFQPGTAWKRSSGNQRHLLSRMDLVVRGLSRSRRCRKCAVHWSGV